MSPAIARRFTMLLGLATLLPLAACSSETSTVAHWRFSDAEPGTVAAASLRDRARSHHATPIGNPTFVAIAPSGKRGGLRFAGSNQRVFVSDSPDFATLRSLTIEVVCTPHGYTYSPNGLNQLVFRGDDRPGNDPFNLAIDADNRVAFFLHNHPILVSPQPLMPNQDTRIAATIDSTSGLACLYINNTLVAATVTSARPCGSLTGPQPGLGIANVQSDNYSQYFQGIIDEVRISNRALSATALLRNPRQVCQPTAPNLCSSACCTCW